MKRFDCAIEMGLDAHTSVQVSSKFPDCSNWAAHACHIPAGMAIPANQCCWTGMHNDRLHDHQCVLQHCLPGHQYELSEMVTVRP